MKIIGSLIFLSFLYYAHPVAAAVTPLDFAVNMDEPVIVDTTGGTPRIAIDVGGTTRYATYTSGSGSAALIFTYTPAAGDLDLDGVALTSPLDLNGGTIRDIAGNNATLTYTLPTTTGVKVDYPSLSTDFINNRYTLNGTSYNSLPSFLTASGGTFSRASTATYFDSTGTLQTAAANTPRFDYDPSTLAPKGILIEESKTNSIPNSTMQGVAAGTPGTLPTGWFAGYNPGGFSYQVIGTGTEKGMSYVDIRFYGNTAADEIQMVPGPGSAASAGQIWTGSAYMRMVGGTTAKLSTVSTRMTWTNPAYISFSATNLISNISSSTLYRGAITATAPATTTTVTSSINLIANAAGADITLRIAAPQREIGTFASSYIPTTNAAVTRNSDRLTIPTAAWFDISKSGLYITGDILGLPTGGGTFQTGIGTDANNYFGFPYISTSAFAAAAYYRSAGAGPLIASASLPLNTVYKASYSYSVPLNTASYYKNGALVGTGSGVNTMASATFLGIGVSPFVAIPSSGHIRNVKYYPAYITAAQLQLLTQ
jgi:hypothetical protein